MEINLSLLECVPVDVGAGEHFLYVTLTHIAPDIPPLKDSEGGLQGEVVLYSTVAVLIQMIEPRLILSSQEIMCLPNGLVQEVESSYRHLLFMFS